MFRRYCIEVLAVPQMRSVAFVRQSVFTQPRPKADVGS
jgi:hypothetical protein